MKKFGLIAVAALLVALAYPGLTKGPLSAAEKMLARIPLDAVDPDQLFEVQYGSPEKAVPALSVALGGQEDAPVHGTARALPRDIAELLLMQLEGAKALVGFDMTEIRESASVSQGGLLMTLYRFEAGIRNTVGPALEALDYTATTRDDIPVWARGEDFTMDMVNRDPANPFGGRLGRWGRVAIDDDLVAWSPGWPAIEGFAAGSTGMNKHPDVAALIDVLDGPISESGILVSARFIIDPTNRLGSPAALIVDMVNGADDMAFLAFMVPPDHAKDIDAVQIERQLRSAPLKSFGGFDAFRDKLGGDAEVTLIKDERPIVLIKVTAPRKSIVMNDTFAFANSLLFLSDIKALLAVKTP